MTLRDDLRIKQGETWRRPYPLFGSSDALAGGQVRGQIRGTVTASVAYHTWSTVEGNIEIEDGVVTLHVPADVSSDWTWSSGLWDLEFQDAAGNVTRLVEGVVWVSPQITR